MRSGRLASFAHAAWRELLRVFDRLLGDDASVVGGAALLPADATRVAVGSGERSFVVWVRPTATARAAMDDALLTERYELMVMASFGLVVGWDGLTDERGRDVPFSIARRADLLNHALGGLTPREQDDAVAAILDAAGFTVQAARDGVAGNGAAPRETCGAAIGAGGRAADAGTGG